MLQKIQQFFAHLVPSAPQDGTPEQKYPPQLGQYGPYPGMNYLSCYNHGLIHDTGYPPWINPQMHRADALAVLPIGNAYYLLYIWLMTCSFGTCRSAASTPDANGLSTILWIPLSVSYDVSWNAELWKHANAAISASISAAYDADDTKFSANQSKRSSKY
jgi:hypothetical protein